MYINKTKFQKKPLNFMCNCVIDINFVLVNYSPKQVPFLQSKPQTQEVTQNPPARFNHQASRLPHPRDVSIPPVSLRPHSHYYQHACRHQLTRVSTHCTPPFENILDPPKNINKLIVRNFNYHLDKHFSKFSEISIRNQQRTETINPLQSMIV